MKRILLLIVFLVASNLFSITATVFWVPPATAQDQGVQNVNHTLAYPRSSERFFDTGQQQLEQEIQRLQQTADTPELLRIDPTIFQQQQNSQQLEQQFLDKLQNLQQQLPEQPPL